MDIVLRNLRALKTDVRRIEVSLAAFNATTPLTKSKIDALEKEIQQLKQEAKNLLRKCSAEAATDDEFKKEEPEFVATQEKLQTAFEKLCDMKSTLSTPNHNEKSVGNADIKLPKLEMPMFNGEVQDWLSFQDLFLASVHNNSKLSGAQKLQYLKGLLKEEPAKLLQNIQITDANYTQAWDTLKARYEDKREIIKSHLDRLMSLPNLQQENPTQLRKIGDSTNECVRALEILKITPEQSRDLLIIHIIMKKLDPESRLEWERSLKPEEIPTIKSFTDFIVQQAKVTSAAGIKSKNTVVVKQKEVSLDKKITTVHYGSSSNSNVKNCPLCTKSKHYLNQCEYFKKMSINEKVEYLKLTERCFNCLEIGHRSHECKSKYCCKSCAERHNTSIHKYKEKSQSKGKEESEVKTSNSKVEEKSSTNHLSNHLGNHRGRLQTLLATALIKVVNEKNETFICRALLDNGSQTSFITKKLANRLGLRQKSINLPISGLGGTEVNTASTEVNLKFSSTYNSDKIFSVYAIVMDNVTGTQPSCQVEFNDWSHITGLQLADPKFFEPGNIDILLGGDIFEDLVKIKKRKGPDGTPYARDSVLGWILLGSFKQNHQSRKISIHHAACNANENENLSKFWELEEIPAKKILNNEESMCEEHFQKTHSRDSDGSYVVRLPFKETKKKLGETRSMAVRRFQSIERRFASQPDKMEEYNNVLQEYIDMGHMQKIPMEDVNKKTEVYYMPHHAVYNEASSTTKVRVVFDASAKSSTGISLNETLLVGPRLQQDLFNILLRFRQHKVALTADIAKMYRQVKLHCEDQDFHRIVWRKSSNLPMQDFKMLTATFGTASAPYQAIKSVQHLAETEIAKFPEAAQIILQDFYVDDLLSGAESDDKALKLQKELVNLLQLGNFQLRKWSSNSGKVLEAIPSNMRETQLPLKIEEDCSIKTLGLSWNPATDEFAFKVHLTETSSWTKRNILSEIAKIFDPLGFLSPTIIKAKIFMQNLWTRNLGWDDPLPQDLVQSWLLYRNELQLIEEINIPRFCAKENSSFQLLGFCDASEKAYAAVVYLQSTEECGNSQLRLVTSKTKVAPVKPATLARLELCGAVLLSRLMKSVKESLTLKIENVYAWTDSTIVLGWLGSPPQRWKTFVSNRVAEIQDNIPFENWSHISGTENPADCASRGISPSELKEFSLWWNGPEFLSNQKFEVDETEELRFEEKKNVQIVCVSSVDENDTLKATLMKFSSWEKLKNVVAFVLRFVHNSRKKSEKRIGIVSIQELKEAKKLIVKKIQSEEFKREMASMNQKKPLPKDTRKIQNLNPFLDHEGILRVGGRLEKANISYDKKHPILLPKNHHVTAVIIRHYHKSLLHAGSQLLLANLQNEYWIPSGRDVVRKEIGKCVVCVRLRAETAKQMMGNLPEPRVTPSRPFQNCGVDFAGPFNLKNARGRNPIKYKAYVSVFICLSTRAIHLEPVSDMSTESFLEMFKRFISTRGKPSDMYSDCGTNFVGADRELKNLLKMFDDNQRQNEIKSCAGRQGIRWHFNPPTGSHFGGLWEAGVKSMKFHLKRVIGNQLLNFEEFLTILKQVEACLNSRPLTALSTDPTEVSALTPGHFLIGSAITAIPEPDLTTLSENRLSRWQMVQRMFQHFWKRWSREHLSRLQQRPKWWSKKANLEVGKLVLVKDDRLPPLMWKMGRITEVYPGTDDCVRVVKVKTADGEVQRPIVKLCLLPID